MFSKKFFFVVILFIIGILIVLNPEDVSKTCYGKPILEGSSYVLSDEEYNCIYKVVYADNIFSFVYFSTLKGGYISALYGKIGIFAGLNKSTFILILQITSLYKLTRFKYDFITIKQ